MSTKLLKSKAFKELLGRDFPLPVVGDCSWFLEQDITQQAEFRTAVRAFCGLGATAFAFLAEVVEHQEIRRKTVSKMVEQVESLGLIFIRADGRFFDLSHRICPSLFGEDVLFAVENLLDSLVPSLRHEAALAL